MKELLMKITGNANQRKHGQGEKRVHDKGQLAGWGALDLSFLTK
jgi:hypothetical protein